jgi:methionyl-tRNA formyltransferase
MKPEDFKVVFMGTPDFAVASLDAIVKAGFNVVGVITSTDKPAGRGKKIKFSAVKEYALQCGLYIIQPPNLKNIEFNRELKSLEADLFSVVAFRMLPEMVWQMPEYGTINLHGSLLPQYRGAAPINWAIVNGEKKTGATTFFIQQKIDTGNIINSIEIPISKNMTAGELHDEMMILGATCIVETIHQIQQGETKEKPQPEGNKLNPAPKIYRETCEIDWKRTKAEVHNHIRGLSPFPCAWTTLNDDKKTGFKISKSKISDLNPLATPGTIQIHNKELLIATTDGFVEILELQMQGKKRMDAKSLLNGYTFKYGAKFESIS